MILDNENNIIDALTIAGNSVSRAMNPSKKAATTNNGMMPISNLPPSIIFFLKDSVRL